METDVNSTIQLNRHTKDNKEYWIKKYALAQYYIGIERTLEIKRDIIGYGYLDKASIKDLKKLIEILRKEFGKAS